MSFVRTDSGISNLFLFSGSSAVVFLEGGASLSLDQVEAGECSTRSGDIRFWQSLFERFCPGIIFDFKSVGSKSAVKFMADKIYNGEVCNVVAVMDRDFDNLLDQILVHPNVIYTYGYSWENDCWSPSAVFEALVSISGTSRSASRGLADEVDDLYRYFCYVMARFVRIDALLSVRGKSFFDRNSFERYLNGRVSKRPEISRAELRKSLGQVREERSLPIRGDLTDVDAVRDCFGHLFEAFSYRVVCYLLAKLGASMSLPKEAARALVVEKFLACLPRGEFLEICRHYETAVGGVVI